MEMFFMTVAREWKVEEAECGVLNWGFISNVI